MRQPFLSHADLDLSCELHKQINEIVHRERSAKLALQRQKAGKLYQSILDLNSLSSLSTPVHCQKIRAVQTQETPQNHVVSTQQQSRIRKKQFKSNSFLQFAKPKNSVAQNCLQKIWTNTSFFYF